MKSFIFKVLFFSVPVLIYYLPASIILLATGESYLSVEYILRNQDENTKIGYAYNQKNIYPIKWNSLVGKHHDVVAIGSSRVLEFREEMFIKPFYNFGWTVGGTNYLSPLLEALPDSSLPDLIILGLDHNFFNRNWVNKDVKVGKDYWLDKFVKKPSFKTINSVYKDLYNENLPIKFLLDKPIVFSENLRFVGMNAFFNDNGFRKDGSMLYNTKINNLLSQDRLNYDLIFEKELKEVHSKFKNSFMRGHVISEYAIKALESFYDLCEKKNVYVISFLPPIAERVYIEMTESREHIYLNDLYVRLKSSTDKYGFELFNFSTPISCNSSDDEMLDGQHGSELVYARILLEMCSQYSRIKTVVDEKELNRAIGEKINRYVIYPN